METLETAAAGSDVAQIRRATEALRVEADKLAENVYARGTETTQSRSSGDDNIVDADFGDVA